jgi:hypothetical protein
MKQTKSHKMRFKQPKNGDQLSSKLTPRSKRNKNNEKHKRKTPTKIKQLG